MTPKLGKKYKPETQTTKRTSPPTITEQDIDFISFSFDEHIRLAEMRVGCTWEHTVKAEKKRAYGVVNTLHAVRKGKAKLDEDEVMFIEFALNERCDFATEGVGELWCTDGLHESIKAACILKKLRRLCERTGVQHGLSTSGN